jgi:hypothetical protein
MKPLFRNMLLLFIIMNSARAYGQLTVNVLIPPSGLMDKQQLWNIIVTNTEPSTFTVQLQISFSELGTGQPVFTASTNTLVVPSGTKQLSASTVGAVQYNTLNSNYRIDPGPTGLLPVGTFMVCYDFLIVKFNKVVQECHQVTIPPLGPLLLNQPANGSALQEFHPLFSWLPPTPVQSLTTLRYDLKLVEVLPNQSAADAIQDNIPVYISRNLATSNFQYMQNAPALQPEKEYAWQVTAMNKLTEIAKSESWSFTTKQPAATPVLPKPDPVYIKLLKAGDRNGYAVYWGDLRFDYLNETTDTVWNINVEDLSGAQHVSFDLPMDNIKLGRGQNLVSYKAAGDNRFIDKHLYVLKVSNSRNEVWQVSFEYRKQDK